MTVSVRGSFRDDRLFDEQSLGSMQPSDEWGGYDESHFDDAPDDERSYDQSNVQSTHYEEESTVREEEPLGGLKETFFAKQNAIVDYFAELVPTFSVESSKKMDIGRSMSESTYSRFDTTATFSQYDATATFSQYDASKSDSKVKRYGSTHSRCIIENTETIQERQDEERRRMAKGGEDDDARDQASTMNYSVEEISQISDLTMDMHTVVAQQRFAQCSALPTISEVKEFQSPQIAATCASGVVKGKAQCAAATDTTTNKDEGNADFLDFVFELVEDAICKPIKTSKSERKKVFMEAFHEESEKILKLAKKNGAKDPSRESSRHSRSSIGTNRSTLKPKNSEFPMDEDEEPITNQVETSVRSSRKSDHSRMKMVDKPPPQPRTDNAVYPLNEEFTIDWSRMMSLAEKQFEADENSVASNDSGISEVSAITETLSMFQSVKCDEVQNHDASVVSKESSRRMNLEAPVMFASSVKTASTKTATTSSSTQPVLTDDLVQELRELSALDSSSFEEESRFILTTSLFRYMKSFVPKLSDFKKKKSKAFDHEERAFDEVSVASIPSIGSMDDGEFTCDNRENPDEEMMLRVMHYVAFFYAFVFWPTGVTRKQIQDRKNQKSLLQLVSER